METKKYQLPKEFGTKWVVALRSGEYEQTREILGRVEDGNCSYCCLGVAAYMQGVPMDKLKENGEICELTIWDTEDETNDPYFDLINIGIPMLLIDSSLTSKLITLNDTDGYTFSGIADWIETNVEFI